jgi:signal transduction histidine kinase
MNLKKIFSQFNILAQCRKYGLPFWQCPQFVFVGMGIIIIISTLFTYGVSSKYIEDPLLISLIVILLAWVLLILSYVVTHSFERLAEASRMKLEFLTIMTHQIRAPFANLRWVIDLLMSKKVGSFGEKQEEYFKILRENSDRLEELIDKIITVSKIEQGKLPLRKKLFSLEEIINKVILEFKPFAEASNVRVLFETQKKLPKILGDASQVREVVENFVDNAIKYTKEKGEVEISLLEKDRNVYLGVKDSGVGIPEEDQKYIFRKFFRSESAMRHQTQGSGLGLFIAKSIIESHKGKIGFDSQKGKGSTFWFTLPIKQ